MSMSVEDAVEAIRDIEEAAMRRPSPFHLRGCRDCGAPTSGYPCIECRSWADYSDGDQVRVGLRESARRQGCGTRERFVALAEKAGGIGPYFLANWRRRVPYDRGDPAFVRVVDGMVARAAAIEWPEPGEVWDAVKAGRDLPVEGAWARRREAVDAKAAAIFGSGGVDALKAKNPRDQFRWPENCEEGLEIVARCADEHLLALLERSAAFSPGP